MEINKNIGEDKLEQEAARIRVGKTLTFIATAGCGYLFANTHAVFGAYPFGIAMLCASRRGALAMLAGLVLGALALGEAGYVYISVFLIIAAARLLVSGKSKLFFREIPQLSIAISAVAAGILSVYEIIVSGADTASILFAASNIAIVPVLTFLYLGVECSDTDVFHSLVRGEKIVAASPTFYFASLTTIVATLVLSVGKYELFGISVSAVAASVAALLAARHHGALRGGILGLVAGAAASADLSFAIALLGAAFGALAPLSYPFALAAAVVLSVGCESFVFGISGFLSIAPEIALALAVSWPMILQREKKEAASNTTKTSAAAKARGRRAAAFEDRGAHIDGLAASLTGLSNVIRTLGDEKLYPGELDYRATIDDACRKYCINCKFFDDCWHRGDEGCAAAVRKISERYSSLGVAALSELPARLRGKCPCLEGLIADVSAALASLDAQCRIGRGSKLISLDYELISDLIAEASRADKIERREDIKAGLELRRAYRTLGIVSGDVAVYGERRRSIIAGGIDWEGSGISATDLHDVAETLCGCALSKPGFEIEDGMVTMQMSSVRRYGTEVAYAVLGAEELCGDRCAFFENSEDYHYTLICDGMGSGEEANRASGICGLFLEKLLSGGNSKSASLRLLNHALKNRGEECSSSIDLFEVDLLYGRGCFVKSGAAPSYVRRGEKLFRLQSKTIPVGLMTDLDAQSTRFDVNVGDVIIMLSDGVIGPLEDGRWLGDILIAEDFSDLSASAKRILALAKSHSDVNDDITVALTRITEYKPAASVA